MPMSRKLLQSLLPIVLVSLAGCATQSPVPQVLPRVSVPAPAPELMETELANYSESAQAKFKAWQERLIVLPAK